MNRDTKASLSLLKQRAPPSSQRKPGGSPRIYAGELGFQAERFHQPTPPALAAGFRLELQRDWIHFRFKVGR